jgi:integrase
MGVQGLYRDGDGRYRIDLRWRQPSGERGRYKEVLPRGIAAGAAKKRALTALTLSLSGGLRRTDRAEVTRLRDAFDRYLDWVKTNRPKAHGQRTSITRVWLETVGDVPIERLDPTLVERYKSRRVASGAAPATINKGVATLKHMCGLAARMAWPWMTRERAALVREVEMLKEPPGRQRPIQPHELDAIIAAFRRKNSRFARRVVCASLLSGCRLGELLDLRVNEVRLFAMVIDLSRTKQNRNHQVPVGAELAELLRDAMAESKGGFVFVNSRGKPYTVSGFSKHFANVAKRAGVPDITFHDLRRHVGTVLINAGERLEVVSRLLGHSNVAVTQRSYAHITTETARRAVSRLTVASGSAASGGAEMSGDLS